LLFVVEYVGFDIYWAMVRKTDKQKQTPKSVIDTCKRRIRAYDAL
jgi:hypothetical protein